MLCFCNARAVAGPRNGRVAFALPAGLLLVLLMAALGAIGCGKRAAKVTEPRPAATETSRNQPAAAASPQTPAASSQPSAPSIQPSPMPVEVPAVAAPDPPLPPRINGPRTLADLAERAAAEEFKLPEIDENKVAAAGIRRLEGKHITIYTDVPESDEVAQLPRVFDAAVPLYCEYFNVPPEQVADWKVIGYLIKDKERFQGAGLFPDNLPDFPNGYTRGSEFWWYDQPSDYYRRHLMLHEGVHAFMFRWLGGAGPPWYTEGMAELLGTHRWADGALQLAYTPRSKDEVPYWGRVRIVRDQFAAGRGLQLLDVLRLDQQAHLRNEAYGWCWAAAEFLDHHPKTRDAFRALKENAKDRSIDFSTQFVDMLRENWADIDEDWQLFVANNDYGYDVARAAIVRKDRQPLPAAGGTVTIAADRGWQSTGFEVEAGKTYAIRAAGQYQVGESSKPWISEADGITLHYHQGQPLGKLLAGVSETGDEVRGLTPLARPVAIGSNGTFTPAVSGVLYLSINESPAGLGDNRGSVAVQIKAE